MPQSKKSWPRGLRGPVFGYPQRGFALLKGHWLIEIPNNKFQKTIAHAAQAAALRVEPVLNL